MTLESYITEAISTGKHRKKYYDDLTEYSTIADYARILEDLGYKYNDFTSQKYYVIETHSNNKGTDVVIFKKKNFRNNRNSEIFAMVSFPFGMSDILASDVEPDDWPKDPVSQIIIVDKPGSSLGRETTVDELKTFIYGE